MSNRTIEAVLRLSAKLGSMQAFGQMGNKLDQVDRKAKAFNRTQGAMSKGALLAGRTIAGAVAGIATVRGAASLVTNFAEAERRLNRIAINADASEEQLSKMFRTVDRAANDYAMSQQNVTEGMEALVASGRSLEDALGFLPSVAATAQASGAEVADIANTADAVAGSFGFAADEMQRAFDILVTSGKQGKFELKDMAQYLPSLAPAMRTLGYRGEEGLGKLASMLQTVRMQTGGASEAATALQNVLQKMESNETAKKFGEFGIDLRKEMAKARREGKDLLEVFMDLTDKATKGQMHLLPQLFTDAQFQAGMRALLQGRGALQDFIGTLRNASGATERDLNRVLSDTQAKVDRLSSSYDRLGKTAGAAMTHLGVGDAMDFASRSIDYGMAVDAGLEQSGVKGWVSRSLWGAVNDRKAHDSMAWMGGYRSDRDRSMIDNYGRMAAGRATRVPREPSYGFRMDQNGVPVPVSQASQGQVSPEDVRRANLRAQYGLYGERNNQARVPTRRERAQLNGRLMGPTGDANYDEFRRAAALAGDEIESSGKQAGQSMAETAASVLKSMASSIGELLGTSAATSFNRNAKAPQTIHAPTANLGRTRPGVRADTGISQAGKYGPR